MAEGERADEVNVNVVEALTGDLEGGQGRLGVPLHL